MEILQFTTDLDENVARLNALFAQDKTFIVRRLRAPEGLRCAVFFFDGMIDNQAINQSIVRPLLRAGLKSASAEALAESVLQINECRVETDLHAMLTALLYGDTVVLT